tara:strand:- start:1989 stop:2210 length:222 start_codon:yes stop_codon:yes gene_type:complete
MSFIDDPRAEEFDKYGRVYRPETVIIKSNSSLGGAIKSNEDLDLFDRAKRKRKSSFNKVRLPKYISKQRRVSL